jgi:molybdenum cofactor cytidylyltransferase
VKSKVAAVILAAGSSSRLGKPKQLLLYNGATFIENSVRNALDAGCLPVVVVLGANREEIIPVIDNYLVEIVINEDWNSGMGSSISSGISKIESVKDVKASILMVCDQPFVSKELLKSLIITYENSGGQIVASSYGGIVGVPALFDQRYFSELAGLAGNEGAKRIIQLNKETLIQVPFEEGSLDIDTLDDYKKLS